MWFHILLFGVFLISKLKREWQLRSMSPELQPVFSLYTLGTPNNYFVQGQGVTGMLSE